MRIRKNWTKTEQALFLVHLGQCLGEGYTLLVAMRFQFFHRNQMLRNDIEKMIAALEEGWKVHEILRAFHFPEAIVCSIYFSEKSGDLFRGLTACGHMLQRQEENRRRLGRLLRYPLFLLWLLLLMLYIIGHFLLPNFLQLYHSLQIDLPLITRVLLILSNHAFLLAALLLAVITAGLLLWIYSRRLPVEKKIQIALHLPILRHFLRHLLTQKFSFYFGSMLRSGLSIRQAVDALKDTGATPFLNYEAERLRQCFDEGRRFTEAIDRVGYFLPDMVSVIRQGELGGILGESLARYSDAILVDFEEKMEQLLSYVQPAILIFVGGLVLGLFSAVLLPIFHIVNGL
ncbi:competence type IV pilus assembly protein ComGB [Sporolactobacillus spathodeae]|uniref:Competence protein ComGB n=1 Tax=Sporolactobacillus spathodeae TaxID=1465502 RepID=A0ABS2QCP3_9BACL|nr:competence type IV pilus assembly protein ComGB [Sporolactobacillus spathodeae]MBM7658707.1 competence protein ComGB [Sporolactobacillus spathodeae]